MAVLQFNTKFTLTSQKQAKKILAATTHVFTAQPSKSHGKFTAKT